MTSFKKGIAIIILLYDKINLEINKIKTHKVKERNETRCVVRRVCG